MNNEAVKRLTEFLDSECDDYDIDYSYEIEESYFDVTVRRDDFIKSIYFRYDEKSRSLEMDMYEDNWVTVKEYDQTIKHFWMVVAPYFWPVR